MYLYDILERNPCMQIYIITDLRLPEVDSLVEKGGSLHVQTSYCYEPEGC